jgi:catechol 2,3-dioxygenase-like lactoylglutathione lyase family enzyme
MKKPIRSTCILGALLGAVVLFIFSQAPVARAQSSATVEHQPQEIARVLRVTIVCRDVEATTRFWAEIFSLPTPTITTTAPAGLTSMDYRSTTPHVDFKRAIIQLENTQVEFVQPVGKSDSPEAAFVKSYPAGVRRVLFALADSNAPERLKKLGLTMRTQGGRDLYVEKADRFGVVTEWTAPKNSESLDTLTMATAAQARSLGPAPNGGLRSLMQVALASNDLKGTSQRWAELLGVPAPQVPSSGSTSWMFRGQPSHAQIIPVFIPFGSTEIEVIAVGPGEGTNNFKEFLNHRGGDGVEHFAFSVDDMDASVKRFEEFGIEVGLTQAPRPDADPSRPSLNLHMMNALDKLGVDVELFHQMTCCYNQMARMNRN